ncbi:EthD domain-containing protein [Granulicoccus phenolivorans]|uniref:EthD domain-containing protein n=1 Tax=Granulicoccus phenolivorans TaxID=266854 RepID=UPI00041E6C2F|nr:EthD domain-containing protein [Granulicoccus phenolivorans]
MSLRHRIAFLKPRPGAFESIEAFQDYWANQHGELVMPIRGIVGYRQNRPVDPEFVWDDVRGFAELFFSDAAGEDRAWADPAARPLSVDEKFMFDVENGFSVLVTAVDHVRTGFTGRTRLLALGGDPADIAADWQVGAVDVLHLDEAPRVTGGGDTLLSVYTRGRDVADRVGTALGVRYAVVETVPMIVPDDASLDD